MNTTRLATMDIPAISKTISLCMYVQQQQQQKSGLLCSTIRPELSTRRPMRMGRLLFSQALSYIRVVPLCQDFTAFFILIPAYQTA